MRSIYYLFILFILAACSSDNSDESNFRFMEVPKGHAYVQSKSVDDDIVKVLQYTGIDVLEDIDIKLHTNNSHYFYFAAVVDFPINENDGWSVSDGQLKSLKTFNGCFIYDLAKDDAEDQYLVEDLSIDLMVDKKINTVLGNDSLYLSLNGIDYHTMPKPMRLSFYGVHRFNGNFYNLDSVVPLFSGNVWLPENKGKDIESRFLVGLISYDCTDNIDFDSLYNSTAFAYAVAIPDRIGDTNLEYVGRLDINDFIVEAE